MMPIYIDSDNIRSGPSKCSGVRHVDRHSTIRRQRVLPPFGPPLQTSFTKSVDWLLGLSQKDQFSADIVPEAVHIEPNAPSPVDERLMRWHLEAAGYKIRHVPTTFPDLLKIEPVVRFEYERFTALGPERGLESAHSKLTYLRRPETDMEACNSVQAVGDRRARGEWQQQCDQEPARSPEKPHILSFIQHRPLQHP
jgi:hypothetical protein